MHWFLTNRSIHLYITLVSNATNTMWSLDSNSLQTVRTYLLNLPDLVYQFHKYHALW